MHDGFALPCPRQSNHGLPGAHHLSWLGERLHHHAIGISKQHRITGRIASDISLRLRRAQLSFGGICGGFDLIVGRGRDGAGGDQVVIPGLVIRGLYGSRPGGHDRLLLRPRLQPEINRVEAHQWLTSFDRLACVNQALEYFARDPKTKVSLDAGDHDPREST
ncbi:hypothetical protein EMIT093MI4_50221 [Pseudomonas sp. IT-93MI4]